MPMEGVSQAAATTTQTPSTSAEPGTSDGTSPLGEGQTDTAPRPEYEYFSQDPRFPAKLIVGALFVGAFFGYLNETLLNVALTPLMSAFGVDKTTVQWLTTGFLLTMGALTPITAGLIRGFRTRTMALASLGTFLLGSIICAAAGSFEVLLAGRLVQAVSAALTVPLLMNAILAIYPPEKRGRAMALVAMIFTVAPALGPTLSGIIVDHLGWRYLFLVTMPFILLAIGLVMRYLTVDLHEVGPLRIDMPSAFLSTLGFGGLVYAASSFASFSAFRFGALLVGACLMIGLFARRQLRLDTPLLDLRAFGHPQFRYAAVILAMAIFLLLGLELLLPMYMQQVLLFTGTVTGFVLLPASIAEAVMAPVFGNMLDKRGGRAVLLPGGLVMVASLAALWWVAAIDSSPIGLGLAFGCFGIAVASAITGETHGLNALPKALHPHGTAIIATLNPVAGALGAACFVGAASLGESLSAQTEARLAMFDGVKLALSISVCCAVLVLVLSLKIRLVRGG